MARIARTYIINNTIVSYKTQRKNKKIFQSNRQNHIENKLKLLTNKTHGQRITYYIYRIYNNNNITDMLNPYAFGQ